MASELEKYVNKKRKKFLAADEEAAARTARKELGATAVMEGAANGIAALLKVGKATGEQIHVDVATAQASGLFPDTVFDELITEPIPYRGRTVRLRGGVHREDGIPKRGIVSILTEYSDSRRIPGGTRAVACTFFAELFEDGTGFDGSLVRGGEQVTKPGRQIGAGKMMNEIAGQFMLPRPDLPHGTITGARRG